MEGIAGFLGKICLEIKLFLLLILTVLFNGNQLGRAGAAWLVDQKRILLLPMERLYLRDSETDSSRRVSGSMVLAHISGCPGLAAEWEKTENSGF